MPQNSAAKRQTSASHGLEIVRRNVQRVEAGSGVLRFSYVALYADGRRLMAAVRATDDGRIIDLQAEAPEGFRAGTTGDVRLDAELKTRVRSFVDARRHLLAIGDGDGR